MPDFIPRAEAMIGRWTRNFTKHVVADPESLGITQAQADELQLRQEAFDVAAAVATKPDTRSPVAIAERNRCKAQLLDWVRRLAWFIRKTPGIDSAQLITLGLRTPKAISRVPSPREAPTVFAKPTGTHSVRVVMKPAGSPRIAKPDGVSAAAIFIAMGEQPSADPKSWTYHSTQTRAAFQLTIREQLPYGQSIWIAARWLNPRGKAGPVSQPRQVRVTGGAYMQLGTSLAAA